jgi:polysaccharide biosynthesis/export protein
MKAGEICMPFRGFVSMLLLLVCAACASGTPAGRIEQSKEAAPAEVSLADYRLGPGDQLRVNVFDEPSLTGQYDINPQGRIAFPLVGEVPAGNLTVTEFSRSLEGKLKQGFLRAPQVTTEVVTYRPFYILGEVVRPGTYPFAAGLTVMNAAATAGGFSYRADTRRVYIKRVGEERETSYPLTSKTPVQPGDTVRIGERIF